MATVPALTLALVLAAVSSRTAIAASRFPPGPTGTCTDTMTISELATWLNTTTPPCNATTPNFTGSPGDTVFGISGVVIALDQVPTGFDIYLQLPQGGPNSGMDVFTMGVNEVPLYALALGDSLTVEFACIADFYGDVRLSPPNNNFSLPNIVLRRGSSGNSVPPPTHGNTSQFDQSPANGFPAPYLSTPVRIDGPVRVARTDGLATGGALIVTDDSPADSVYVDYFKLSNTRPPPVGTYLNAVTGIVNSTMHGWTIMPRDATDRGTVPTRSDSWGGLKARYR